MKKISKEIVNERINDRGLTMISDYINVATKSQFKCDHGHLWLSKPNNIINGNGCPHCSGLVILSKEIVNERISNSGITMISDYINANTKSQFKCLYDHYWKSKPSHVMSGSGCPTCARHGYDPNKPGTFYVLDFGQFIKFGISNHPEQRFKQHKKNGEFTVAFSLFFNNGDYPLNLEREIKRVFGGNFVTKEQCRDGYTETLCESKLEELLNFLNIKFMRDSDSVSETRQLLSKAGI